MGGQEGVEFAISNLSLTTPSFPVIFDTVPCLANPSTDCGNDMGETCLISDGRVGGTGFMSWVDCTIA